MFGIFLLLDRCRSFAWVGCPVAHLVARCMAIAASWMVIAGWDFVDDVEFVVRVPHL